MRLAAALAALALSSSAIAADAPAITPFSTAAPGEEIPAGWERISLPYGPKSEIKIVRGGDRNVLSVLAKDSFGSIAFKMSSETQDAPILTWQWKVDRVVDKANMEVKGEEDFAARVYVAFDFPESEISTGDRAKLKIARAVQGFVPAAAICYVWDNKHAKGTAMPSPHFDHVHAIVLESGNERAGQWVEESRDVEADFIAAFGEGWKGRIPKVNGIIVGNDTDQSGESVNAWFGDVRLGPRK